MILLIGNKDKYGSGKDPGRVTDATDAVSGTWFVVRSSLGLWRSRTDPVIGYLRLRDGRVLDAVSYRRRGAARTVIGIDEPAGDGWVWRGVGPLTRWARSSWRMVAVGEDWAVSLFARTPFTAAGLDVLWRTAHPDPAALQDVLNRLAMLADAAPYRDRLFAPVHQAPAGSGDNRGHD